MVGGLGRGRHRGNSRSVLDRLVTATAHQLRMIVEFYLESSCEAG